MAPFDPLPCDFGHVLVVPAFAESPACLDSISALQADLPVLAILVCNAPASASAAEKRRTETLWASTGVHDQGAGIGFRWLNGHVGLLAIDAWSPGREAPDDGGVGYARGLGTDVALRLIEEGQVSSPWVHCSDADATWQPPYFAVPNGDVFLHAFDYLPIDDRAVAEATTLYDAWLWYHAAKLTEARSPYAFYAVGSTMSVRARTLAMVRGFPRRSGGEDFHLLNKARKVGSIHLGQEVTVRLRPRVSRRTPIGTGVGVATILAADQGAGEPRFLDPSSYVMLGSLLRRIRRHAPACAATLRDCLEGLSEPTIDIILTALDALGSARITQHLSSQRLSERQRVSAWMTWFDGLKTLRFLHAVRDSGFPSMRFIDLARDAESPSQAAARWRSVVASDPELLRAPL